MWYLEERFSEWVELGFMVHCESGQPEAGVGADGSRAASGVLCCLLFSMFLYWHYS